MRYVLEGSARRSDKRLRVNVQLINAAEGGNHVWAERFDRELADIFELQDEVSRRIVEAISGKLSANEVADRYRPASLEAYDCVVRSRWQWNESRSSNAEALKNLQRAIALDPNYCEAYWGLAFAQCFGWVYWGEPQQPNREDALANGRRAVEIDPQDSSAHFALGYALLYDRCWEESKSHFSTAIQLNPNSAHAFAGRADLHTFEGNGRAALEDTARALRLNPVPPNWYFWVLGLAQIIAGKYESAVATLTREETYGSGSRLDLVAALSLLGRLSEANEEAKLLLATNPHYRIRFFVETTPFKNSKEVELYVNALRLAGLPE